MAAVFWRRRTGWNVNSGSSILETKNELEGKIGDGGLSKHKAGVHTQATQLTNVVATTYSKMR